jgi:hypothetical protein
MLIVGGATGSSTGSSSVPSPEVPPPSPSFPPDSFPPLSLLLSLSGEVFGLHCVNCQIKTPSKVTPIMTLKLNKAIFFFFR